MVGARIVTRTGCLLAFLLLGSAASAAPLDATSQVPKHKDLRLAANDCSKRLPGQDKNGQSTSTDCPIDTTPTAPGGARPDQQHILLAQYSFSSPLFWVEEGALYGRLYFRGYATNGGVYSGALEVGTLRNDLFKFQQELRYGITDDLSVDVVMSEDPHSNEDFKPIGLFGFPTTEYRSGLENPTFNLRYRVLWQDRDPIFLYLDANYSPNLFPTRDPAPGHPGSVASGRNIYGLGPQVGYAIDDFIFIGSFKEEYRTEGRSGSDRFKTEWASTAGLDVFQHISPYFGYKLSAQYSWDSTPDKANKLFGAQLIIAPIPNELQFSLLLQRSYLPDTFYAPLTSEVRNRHQDFGGLVIEYLFGSDE